MVTTTMRTAGWIGCAVVRPRANTIALAPTGERALGTSVSTPANVDVSPTDVVTSVCLARSSG